MPVESWIYGNARRAGQKADGFFVRRCDAGMEEYRQQMLTLSKTLLEGMKRGTQQECWAAGYLDEERHAYVIAVAANQEELLGMDLHCQENRGFFCVMAYRLSEDEIQLYQRDSRMFEPLKEAMRQVNEGRKEASARIEGRKEQQVLAAFDGYQVPALVRENFPGRYLSNNILKSTEETDEVVWSMGLRRMVFTGVATEESARKLLNQFPDGIVTVRKEHVREMQYLPQRKEPCLPKKKEEEERAEKEGKAPKAVKEAEKQNSWKEQPKENPLEEEQVWQDGGNGLKVSYLVWAGGGIFVFLLLFLLLVQNGL